MSVDDDEARMVNPRRGHQTRVLGLVREIAQLVDTDAGLVGWIRDRELRRGHRRSTGGGRRGGRGGGPSCQCGA
jgi:hypothetical protein